MIPDSLFFIYLGVIFLAILGGAYKLRSKDTASKILVALLCLTLASELIAHWAAIKYRNNMFVYHIFSPIQLIVLGVYFDKVVGRLHKKRIATTIGIVAAIAAVVNTAFFQSLKTLNSNFLLLEGLIIMALALYAFQLILSDDKINIYRYGHFWMIVILIFFWSVTYTTWALHSVLKVKKLFVMPLVTHLLWTVNVITYSAIGFVLLYFSGKRLANE
ncbi:MAG TPA: hypothetical protein VEB40_14635 [Flavipsychrobacter sp.]|nr:hypothetical protein [Flavipsychrobacter sp.]